jgi:hypothetical protein
VVPSPIPGSAIFQHDHRHVHVQLSRPFLRRGETGGTASAGMPSVVSCTFFFFWLIVFFFFPAFTHSTRHSTRELTTHVHTPCHDPCASCARAAPAPIPFSGQSHPACVCSLVLLHLCTFACETSLASQHPYVFPCISSPMHLCLRPLGYMASIASQHLRTFTHASSPEHLCPRPLGTTASLVCRHQFSNTQACSLTHSVYTAFLIVIAHVCSLASQHLHVLSHTPSLVIKVCTPFGPHSFPHKSTPVHVPLCASSCALLPCSSWATQLPLQVGTDTQIPAHLPSHTSGYVASLASQGGTMGESVRRLHGFPHNMGEMARNLLILP